MSTKGPNDDDDGRTIIRPRSATPAGAAPASPPAASWQTPPARAPGSASAVAIGDFLGGGLNSLVQAASPLLLLAVQLSCTVSQPDAVNLREQVINQVRQFEARAQAAGIPAQTITAARYALCTMLDESVLNTPWGEHSGWAAKTLLVTFHNEAWGGEKFFQILERLGQDFSRHLDLIELMYVCLTLGFGGRYRIEAGGRARLADIQEDLYRRIRALRQAGAEELAPHWQGIEDRRNPLIRYVPLWVIAAAGAVILLGVFLYFYERLNALSEPLSSRVAQIGLESAKPGDARTAVAAPAAASGKTLKQLLSSEEAAGALSVTEEPDGHALVRLSASEMFPSGGAQVGSAEIALLHEITAALNQVPGRVIVVGHTDDSPIHSLRFKDNFELSAERAKAVVQILSQGLDNPARLESSGAGSSQPVALPPGLPANRARNRRVEIIHYPEG